MLIDSHAHIAGSEFDSDRDVVIARARQAGVVSLIDVGYSLEQSERAIKLAAATSGIFAAVALHPHEAGKHDLVATRAELERLAKNDRVVAIGECGLDYHEMRNTKEEQAELFRMQIALAQALNLPLILHCRDAYQDMAAMLGEYARSSKRKGVVHCFGGTREEAELFLNLGFFISFTAQITYPRRSELRDVVTALPLDRMLIETDCPYLAPQKFRGTRNEPSYVTEVARTIAEVKTVSYDEVAKTTAKNTMELFQIPEETL